MKPSKTDQQFEKDLNQVKAAYQSLDAAEPPDLIDQAVLNRARRAVQKRPPLWHRTNWIPALATTAVIVVALSSWYSSDLPRSCRFRRTPPRHRLQRLFLTLRNHRATWPAKRRQPMQACKHRSFFFNQQRWETSGNGLSKKCRRKRLLSN